MNRQNPQRIEWHLVLRPAIVSLILLTILTGAAYPALITGIAHLAFPEQARGSLIRDARGRVLGSALIGQSFDDPALFWSRPSATAIPYDASASSGSNLGPLNPALIGPSGTIATRVKALHEAEKAAGVNSTRAVPVDLVTASASGLDPHISPAAALYQSPRVAAVRHVDEAQVVALVKEYTEGRTLGFLGEERVNVLRLNMALIERFPM